ncbi:15959_t:CDS:1, partial [Gigaspora margarita]
ALDQNWLRNTKFKYNLNARILKLAKELDIEVRSEYDYNEWWLFQQLEKEAKTIMKILLEHDRMKN